MGHKKAISRNEKSIISVSLHQKQYPLFRISPAIMKNLSERGFPFKNQKVQNDLDGCPYNQKNNLLRTIHHEREALGVEDPIEKADKVRAKTKFSENRIQIFSFQSIIGFFKIKFEDRIATLFFISIPLTISQAKLILSLIFLPLMKAPCWDKMILGRRKDQFSTRILVEIFKKRLYGLIGLKLEKYKGFSLLGIRENSEIKRRRNQACPKEVMHQLIDHKR